MQIVFELKALKVSHDRHIANAEAITKCTKKDGKLKQFIEKQTKTGKISLLESKSIKAKCSQKY